MHRDAPHHSSGARMTPGDTDNARRAIERNSALYEALVADVRALARAGRDEDALAVASIAAKFAWTHHAGRYADGRLENTVADIGARIGSAPPPGPAAREPRTRGRNVLHVTTMAIERGGHTRSMYSWIVADPDTRHSVVFTGQRDVAVPAWLSEAVAASGGRLTDISPADGLLARIRALRALAQSGFDIVVLHHHPNDVVPVAAFAVPDLPPVAMRNHSDIMFSLGTSVSDLVVEYRDCGAVLSKARRGVERSFVLPTPMHRIAPAGLRHCERRKLGFPHDALVLLTVGSAYKYTPVEGKNFFRVMRDLLEKHPRLHLVIAGDDWSRHREWIEAMPERVRVLNGFSTPLEELTGVHAAADIYVEGYPIGSQIALLEIASIGVPVVLAPHFGAPVMTTDDCALEGIVAHPVDENDYIRKILELAEDPALRLAVGDRLAVEVTRRHYGDFPLFAETLYQRIEACGHAVRTVPDSRAEYTADDLAIASFHESNNTDPGPLYAYTRQLRGALSARAMLQLRRRARQSQADASALRPWLTLLAEKTIKDPMRSAYRTLKNHDRH